VALFFCPKGGIIEALTMTAPIRFVRDDSPHKYTIYFDKRAVRRFKKGVDGFYATRDGNFIIHDEDFENHVQKYVWCSMEWGLGPHKIEVIKVIPLNGRIKGVTVSLSKFIKRT
jgi:hypothetical protein